MNTGPRCGEEDFLLSAYDYPLPPESVAQFPCQEPGSSRLLAMRRKGPLDLLDASFMDLPDLLPAKALIIANNTKVLSARLCGRRAGGGKMEFLPLTPLPLILEGSQRQGERSLAEIECLLKPCGKIRAGEVLAFGGGLELRLISKGDFGKCRALLTWQGDLEKIFGTLGQMPLPPYIRREPENLDRSRYQTIYAKKTGAMAAPTAGLHFTPQLRSELQRRGFLWEELTLHVGYGTFSPVRAQDIRDHKMHAEFMEIPLSCAQAIKNARREGRPIAAIGTTSLRALEGAAPALLAGEPFAGQTDIFLYPGREIKMADCLLTNFHLPKSSLLMLVSAFAGRRRILAAYARAIGLGYRFFSYGDAMLIRPAA